VENEEARVHFIPDLKDGVFVTLCAPLVINAPLNISEYKETQLSEKNRIA
jgi:hypothetical protein